MIQRTPWYLIGLISLLFSFHLNAQKLVILQPPYENKPDAESMAALMFLNSIEHYEISILTTDELKDVSQLKDRQMVWFHHGDSTLAKLPRKAVKALQEFTETGGKLFLTLEGFRAINDLDLEPALAEVRKKQAEDSGYGRKLGLHAFRSHPVFEGLNGGSYIFKPHHDTTVRIIGFFDEQAPVNGKVIAVDWDYIFLRESSKLMLEYNYGEGKILAIGAYACLSQPNINWQHLRLFLHNCLNYLAGSESDIPARFWSYGPQKVMRTDPPPSDPITLRPSPWQEAGDHDVLRRVSENQYWDVAGERMLVMGKENAGLDEIWAHPFMALQHYQVRLVLGDSIIDLSQQVPAIEVRPTSFTRIYHLGSYTLKEVIVADQKDPLAILHYTFTGPGEAELWVTFNSHLRFMWPYSEKVLKSLFYAYDSSLNAFLIHAENKEFNVLIGSNQKPAQATIGHYKGFETTAVDHGYTLKPLPTDSFLVAAAYRFKLKDRGETDIIIAADYQDQQACEEVYRKAASNTSGIDAWLTTSDPAHEYLRIISPDATFNEGYAWALRATDRFMVHTPGLGTSLVAGYGTTQSGWDGGHTVNGRPGYAWYFGRDGQWSGMALLDYGDFEAVKEVLQMYQKFQDLNGKIFHEVSTSGIVHFDASDATPLYIILAGRYLKHSGDVDFIRQSWFHIIKALEFCFSTDTDGDHLIENTNVGHGWVEGGGLFGSHSSLYLSSCWAQALDEAAYMAKALGNEQQADLWMQELARVKKIIHHDFWNETTQFLYQGKFKDGTFHTEQTIMPAIPLYFNQLDKAKASAMLPVFASNNYSSDWGCRIVSKKSNLFNPRGYHTGSVWPLFTGWAALAEYNNGRPVQGYTHIMNNLLVYRHWGLGFVEEVLNGEVYKPSGVCHHQCWSETMVLQPAVEGLLGFRADAVDHFLELAPRLPAHWDSLRVDNIRMGEHLLHVKMNRDEDQVTWSIHHTGPSSLRMIFNPLFEKGTQIKSVTSNGNFEDVRLSPLVPAEFYIDEDITLHYRLAGGIEIIPIVQHPQPGDSSDGIRIISDRLMNNRYTIDLEGPAGSDGKVEVFIRDQEPLRVTGGKIMAHEQHIYTIALTFAADGEDYVNHTLSIELSDE
ncbi:MAG: hypothetical protein KQI35_18120 [Bacteroidetes bacterium]|nr:hypothetical protein [Bacteroidota bacterium]